MRTWNVLGIAVAAAVGFVALMWLLPKRGSFGMFEAGDQLATAKLIGVFAVTVVGVVLGSAYRELLAMKKDGVGKVDSLSKFASDVFRSVDMWLGLVAAPVVFALIVKTSEGMSTGGLLIVALQNGFCAQVIIQTVVDAKGQSTPKKPAPPA